MIQRHLPAVLVLGIGSNELLHAIFDLFDLAFKVKLVGWVISMDKTGDPDALRGIDSTIGAYVAYATIWLAHASAGLIALTGAFRLFTAEPQNHEKSQRAYALSESGIGIAAALYLVGFIAIASGFFLIHTAPTPPNFLANAQRLFLCYMAVIIYLRLTRQ